tara:strand:- start:156 stop:674 length:519 start_codon:yes stop_codon:yes gene_type:complete
MSLYDIPNNNLHRKPYNYSFSKFKGQKYIKSYFINRKKILSILNDNKLTTCNKRNCKTSIELNKILKSNKHIKKFDTLLKRFEVTKKIYDEYSDLYIKKSKNFSKVDNYLIFGLILCKYYSIKKKKNYLNALLKLNDLLISPCFLKQSSKFIDLEILIISEINFIKKIYEKI